jgi:hypothetical protein
MLNDEKNNQEILLTNLRRSIRHPIEICCPKDRIFKPEHETNNFYIENLASTSIYRMIYTENNSQTENIFYLTKNAYLVLENSFHF